MYKALTFRFFLEGAVLAISPQSFPQLQPVKLIFKEKALCWARSNFEADNSTGQVFFSVSAVPLGVFWNNSSSIYGSLQNLLEQESFGFDSKAFELNLHCNS